MGRYENSQRYRRRRRRVMMHRMKVVACCVICSGIVGTGIFFAGRKLSGMSGDPVDSSVAVTGQGQSGGQPGGAQPEQPGGAQQEGNQTGQPEESGSDTQESAALQIEEASPVWQLLDEAKLLAAGYDYDGAIKLLQGDAAYASDPKVQEAIAGYEASRETLVKTDITEVTHVFFHSLVVDTAKAFDGDEDEAGYNQVMTTVDEFHKILQSMYDKGYVLVRLHDLAYETTDEAGDAVMKPGTIMLPEGKIPFVMSQDDLCYYPYMTGDGFATRMIIGEDGKPTCEMKMEDGSTQTGAFDLVPILEDFIQEHPDFSYKGARAVLAFTGYEGILGYRTSSSYQDSPTYEEDRKAAAEVAQCLKDHGWELASHSWGHLNLGTVEWERFKTDCDKWESEVDSLIGPTDIILYPFGADISDWHPYNSENERYRYLHNQGFRYFCNVDSSKYWVQMGKDYIRQGRRNLDGYRMWKDIVAEDKTRRKLDDLFRAEDVFDAARPTPVPEM